MSPRALVTGSSGFCGRHFTAHLRSLGWLVLGLDITQGDDARDFFRGHSPAALASYDLVIHCAAVVGGRAVIDGDPLAQAVNFELDAGLFSWARKASPGRVLYLSSSAAYPVHLQESFMAYRLREDDITLDGPEAGIPDALYGWAKLTGERLAVLARAAGTAVTVVRPFSGYGEDQDPSYPFAAFAARAAARLDPFEIWGTGRQVRDWIHIDDITAACLALCEKGEDGPVNLGSGTGTALAELAARFCTRAGYRPQFHPRRSAPAGPDWRVADVTRMRQYWTPRVSLDEGITRALATQMMVRPRW